MNTSSDEPRRLQCCHLSAGSAPQFASFRRDELATSASNRHVFDHSNSDHRASCHRLSISAQATSGSRQMIRRSTDDRTWSPASSLPAADVRCHLPIGTPRPGPRPTTTVFQSSVQQTVNQPSATMNDFGTSSRYLEIDGSVSMPEDQRRAAGASCASSWALTYATRPQASPGCLPSTRPRCQRRRAQDVSSLAIRKQLTQVCPACRLHSIVSA